jgi:hypothetical protein
VVGIEPHAVSREGAGELDQPEAVVLFLARPERIGHLIFVDIERGRQGRNCIWRERAKLGEVDHPTAKQQVELFAAGCQRGRLVGESDRRVEHPPLPMRRRLGKNGPRVTTLGRHGIQKRAVRPAVISLDRQNVQPLAHRPTILPRRRRNNFDCRAGGLGANLARGGAAKLAAEKMP